MKRKRDTAAIARKAVGQPIRIHKNGTVYNGTVESCTFSGWIRIRPHSTRVHAMFLVHVRLPLGQKVGPFHVTRLPQAKGPEVSPSREQTTTL